MASEQENDSFVSAADFFRNQQAPALGSKAEEPRRPVRESLFVVARNSQVKNKISAFDRGGGPVVGVARLSSAPGAGGAGAARLPHPRRVGAAPALGAIAEEAAIAAPARRHAAVVSTATAGTAAPPHRHAPSAAISAAAPQPPQPVLPSPATKQELAEKRHEARFPSIMFRPPQQQAPRPSRRSLDTGRDSTAVKSAQAGTEHAARGPLPMPAVLVPAPASQTQRQQQQQQLRESQPRPATEDPDAQQGAQPLPLQTLAAVLAAEAAAAVRGAAADSEDEEGHFVDAESGGGGSGGPSLEGSAVWADAHDQHSPFRRQPDSRGEAPLPPAQALDPQPAQQPAANFVIREEDDVASVASDASTVVHDHSNDHLWEEQGDAKEEPWAGQAAEEEPWAEQAAAEVEPWAEQAPACQAEAPAVQPAASCELAAEHAELPGALPAPGDSLLLAAAEVQVVRGATAEDAQPLALGPTADGELFQCASIALPAMEAPPAYRASLSPAVSGRRCSMAATQELEAAMLDAEADTEVSSVRVSLAAGMAAAAELAPAVDGSVVASPADADLSSTPSAAVAEPAEELPQAPGSAFSGAAGAKLAAAAGALAPGGDKAHPAAAAQPALHAEASRASMASMASSAAAPSLHIEFSEASLRYSMDMAAHSPRSQRSHSHSLSQELSAVASVLDAAADVELLPPAAAATPQQHRRSSAHLPSSPPAVPANTPASPTAPSFAAGAERQRSQPTAAIAQAIEQTAAEHGAELRASLASARGSSGATEPAPAAGGSPSSPAAAAAFPGQAAASPAPPTPYAATEYDGDDVVMMDIDSTPRPTTVRRPAPGASRFAAEALASAAAHASPAGPPFAALAATVTAEAVHRAAGVLQEVVDECGAAVPAVQQGQAAEAGEGALPAGAHPDSYVSGQSQLAAKSEQQHAKRATEGGASAEEAAASSVETAAAAVQPPGQDQQPKWVQSSSSNLPELAPADVAARRDRAGRLSMPAGGAVGAAGRSRRASRLSLPSSGRWAGGDEAAAFAPRPRLATSPVVAAQAAGEQLAEEGEQQPSEQRHEPQQPGQQGEQVVASGSEQDTADSNAEADPPPFAIRSRLEAEDEEVPADVAGSPSAAQPQSIADGFRDAAGQRQLHAAVQPAAVLAEQQAAAERAASEPAGACQNAWQEDEGVLAAAAAIPAKPKLATSPAISSGSQCSSAAPCRTSQQYGPAVVPDCPDHQLAEEEADVAARPAAAARLEPAASPAKSSGSQQGASGRECPVRDDEALAAAAFVARPKLAMSPAISSGSQGGTSSRGSPASRPQAEVTYAVAAAAAATLRERQQQQQQQQQQAQVGVEAPSPAQRVDHTQGGGAHHQVWQREQQQLAWQGESPAMSSNPLAGAGATPGAGSRRLSRSPATSGLSAGVVSNNPMYAGTPSHPTPPSVNLKTFGGRLSGGLAGTPQSAGSDGSTPASTGIKLAEKLLQVAEQLQNPAAPRGLAALATPAGARLGAGGRTPATGRFEFAEDVQAIFQALDARTPAAALGQPARAAAAATTVQRAHAQQRLSRFSLGTAGTALLDLDGYDANGNRSGQAGPTPLLRQQLLGGGTPTGVAAAAAGAASAPRSGAPAAAATPVEVKALRDEVKALRDEAAALRLQNGELAAQREEMAGLLGGYQSSIRELQDKHSAVVVRLRGDSAALKAENDELRRAHGEVDQQFRTLYNDKYAPLKATAAGLRQELAALQKRVVAEELKAHKAASDAQAARQELAVAEQRCQDYKAALVEAQAEGAAAREAQQRLQQQLAGEQRRVEKALASQEAELGELRAKYGALTRQYDEAVHKANLAKQARERAQAEVHRKEEEAVALEVRVKELEGALREYKKENGRFFEMKERYKAAIAGLEREVEAKEREKQELLGMCNELMTRLEREGLAS